MLIYVFLLFIVITMILHHLALIHLTDCVEELLELEDDDGI